ncbi:helix-turn-helix domain-containing protein [Hymenobacter defluvii]|uniref:Helix-turn-helix transcriptional regulator n=1 Tax=Hymenobacter defluvii TaxID=2054411 RepID=A0ABS3TB37_9BACT|nr:helix-turn-helix transcriptional regulator [Hymenobacter defluvii]MBO3270856.1 helix-turn-helix transcriptional regulator [Hymenobacter defluvii]
MIERIRQILATRALSPTQFADTIGIGRPVVSHILNGRNKPSLEVMQKIMDAFPDLALPWLLKGEGPMLASAPAEATATTTNTPETVPTIVASPSKKKQRAAALVPSEPSSQAVKPKKEPTSAPPQQISAPEREESTVAAQVPTTPELSVTPPAPVAPAALEVTTLPAALAATPTNKAIRRIIIFYQDGTFTDYQPEK